MNNSERQFLEILSASIRGKSIEKSFENTDWDYIIDLSKKHNVERLVYLGLCRSTFISEIGSNRMALLKQLSVKTDKDQEKHTSRICEVINNISKKNIPILLLKGLVLRELYPMPNERSMSDADLLVKYDDLETVKNILFNMGYSLLEDHTAPYHIAFAHPHYPIIEVHWHLFNKEEVSKDVDHFERLMWKHIIDFKIGQTDAMSLSYEDLAVHLSMDMANYITSTGFGLRQLCDLVLLVEKKGNEIDWNSFIMKTRIYGFERFSTIMFILCNDLFNMAIPEEIDTKGISNKRYIELLTEEIIESGVYGKNDYKEYNVINNIFPKLKLPFFTKKISKQQMLTWMEL